jgi:hypothetical protein
MSWPEKETGHDKASLLFFCRILFHPTSKDLQTFWLEFFRIL